MPLGSGPLVLIVGVCASGKSTLAQGLRAHGYATRSFSQEHSGSARVWRHRKPALLVLLHCQFETIQSRRSIAWGRRAYVQQLVNLQDARQSADIVIQTDGLTPAQLIAAVVPFVDKLREPIV